MEHHQYLDASHRYRDTVALASYLSARLAMAAANYRLRDMAAAEELARPLAGFAPRLPGS